MFSTVWILQDNALDSFCHHGMPFSERDAMGCNTIYTYKNWHGRCWIPLYVSTLHTHKNCHGHCRMHWSVSIHTYKNCHGHCGTPWSVTLSIHTRTSMDIAGHPGLQHYLYIQGLAWTPSEALVCSMIYTYTNWHGHCGTRWSAALSIHTRTGMDTMGRPGL